MTMMEALAAPGRAAEIPAELDVYGWLCGSWTLDVLHYATDVRERAIRGEAHFAWVLEGRAVQDLWIMNEPGLVGMYGTTLRVFDATLGAWRVTWMNPVSGRREELIGRRHGRDIVQIGSRPDGTAIRWCFTDITNDSFRWTGDALQADGITWKLEAEFLGRRMEPS